MKTYIYIVFLKHPVTNNCFSQEIEVDSTNDYLSAIELFEKLSSTGNQIFEEGYTLIGLNVARVEEEQSQ